MIRSIDTSAGVSICGIYDNILIEKEYINQTFAESGSTLQEHLVLLQMLIYG